jgi:ADP-ribosylglycohydrolase
MTRQEEIKEMAKTTASHITSDKDMQVAFADVLRRGAEWADRTMIERACDWIEEFMQMTPSKKTFIKRFKQAMKGEQI